MHEMSLAQSIVEIVESVSQQNNNRDVAKIKLIVGELAGVELQSLMQWKEQKLNLNARKEQLGA